METGANEPGKARKLTWRALLAGLALVVCLGAAAFALFPGGPPVQVSDNYATSPAEPAPAAVRARVEGQVLPRRWAELSLPFGARAEQVLAAEGQQVAAGELLVLLDGHEALRARAAAAEVEVVVARQALQELQDRAGMELARAEVELAQAQKEFDFRRDHLAGLKRPRSRLQIEQVHANLLLADRRLEQAREDLEKARQKFANKKNFIWLFINQRYVRLALNGLEAQVAYHERRFVDAREKYADVLAPVDAVLLAQAQADFQAADERLKQAQTDRDERLDGPEPDALVRRRRV